MRGLCHSCLTSNVELVVSKGNIRCTTCENNGVVSKVPSEYHPGPGKLPFEDLPTATLEERELHANQVASDVFEKKFIKDMINERISEPLIDRIHET